MGAEPVEGEGVLKSQRPRRRKQAGQVARPGMWSVSARQPKRARVRAGRLIGGWDGRRVGGGRGGGVEGVVWDGEAGGEGRGGLRRLSSWGESGGHVKFGGVEIVEGRSAAIAASEW